MHFHHESEDRRSRERHPAELIWRQTLVSAWFRQSSTSTPLHVSVRWKNLMSLIREVARSTGCCRCSSRTYAHRGAPSAGDLRHPVLRGLRHPDSARVGDEVCWDDIDPSRCDDGAASVSSMRASPWLPPIHTVSSDAATPPGCAGRSMTVMRGSGATLSILKICWARCDGSWRRWYGAPDQGSDTQMARRVAAIDHPAPESGVWKSTRPEFAILATPHQPLTHNDDPSPSRSSTVVPWGRSTRWSTAFRVGSIL